MLLEVVIGVVAIILYIYYTLTKTQTYWSDRGVANTGFKFFWGDDKELFTQKESFQEWAWRLYKTFPNERFFGCWTLLGTPYLMIRNDFDLIKSIWIKDFDHFAIANGNVKAHKEIWPANRNEKLMLNNVQSAQGEEWKDIR